MIATIVIDAENPGNKQPLVFRDRSAFDPWLAGGAISTPEQGRSDESESPEVKEELRQLRKLAEELTERLRRLESN